MPDLENPIITDNSAAALKQAIEAHNVAAKDGPVKPGVWDIFGHAEAAEAEAKKAEALKVDDPAKEIEKPKVEEVKEVAKTAEITHETSDEDLNKKVDAEAKQYGLTKAAKVHLANQAFAAREAHRQRKLQAETFQKELDTTKAELAKFRDKAPDSDATQAVQKELEAAKAKLAEKEALLAGTNVRETDDFKTEIAIPMAKLTDEFKTFAADYGVTAEHVIELAGLRGKALDNRIEELTTEFDISSRGVAKLNGLLDRHSEVAAKEKAVMKDAKNSYDNFMQAKREQHDAQLAKVASERAEILPTIWEKAVLSAVPSLKDVNGELGEEIKGVQKFIAQADDAWMLKQSTYDKTRLPAQAAALPVVVKHYEGRLAESATKLAAAEKQIKELTGATPGAAGSGVVKQEPAGDAAGKQAWDSIFAR